ncbi:MAG TPA: permease [Xanthobacteraceae bacterium]|nr:permease [Xanthobacteraceae bacterium]
MSAPATLAWFAAHELRLVWRDWFSMMTAGKRKSLRAAALALLAFVAFMHFMALLALRNVTDPGLNPDKTTLVVVTGSALLAWSLMISQAMESVTRAFYTRADLDLILSSPIAARKVFAVRILTMALGTVVMAALLAGPFIHVLAIRHGPHWLAAYGVVVSMGAAAAALAVALTVLLFRTIGPKRTRLIAQIVAAVIGAAFVIGLQVAAILSQGTISRFAFLTSEAVVARAPDAGSIVWWPARAMLGDIDALAAVAAVCFSLLAAAILFFSARFGEHAIAAAGVDQGRGRQARAAAFRGASPRQALRRKEWTLLRRDLWLVSQTLMQILYLLPPALLLWRSYGDGSGLFVVLTPVLVMSAGQLAGGLAWLAISGEDAPDLVATAPVPAGFLVRAKVEGVLGAVAIVFAPLLAAIALVAPLQAAVAAGGMAIAVIAATMIQLWFRNQAKRSQFRRRHTSSRVATFAEAFSSIAWAATAALAASESSLALAPAAIGILVLLVAREISPRKG